MSNKNLHAAKKAKNDEFYTRFSDVEAELRHYAKHFRGKVVYCNTDSESSGFVQYFKLNFKKLGLKRLVATCYPQGGLIEFFGDTGMCGHLKGNGDFRSPECLALLDEADVVVTNPPFSLFREFIQVLVEHEKKFIVLGNVNAVTYKEIFKLIEEDRCWLGITSPKLFKTPFRGIVNLGCARWFTNLTYKHRNEPLILTTTYKGNEAAYPKYDNYDAINVDEVKLIPGDYRGVMGVPITFLDKYNPEQFEILGHVGSVGADGVYSFANAVYINKKKMFKRVLVRRRRG